MQSSLQVKSHDCELKDFEKRGSTLLKQPVSLGSMPEVLSMVMCGGLEEYCLAET